MASRKQQWEERHAERLRREAEIRRVAQRQKLMRRAGYAAVGVIAAVLVAVAVLGGGGGGGAQSAIHAMSDQGSIATVGAKAPTFTLTNVVNNQPVSSSSLRGHKTMLFFSEGVSCQACLVQAAELQKDATLRKAGIQLVSVTTDKPSDLAAAARQYGITAPLLADPSTEMSNQYGMLGHGGMNHATQDGHAFMLLGADGKVLWHKAYTEMYVQPSQLMHDMKTQEIS